MTTNNTVILYGHLKKDVFYEPYSFPSSAGDCAIFNLVTDSGSFRCLAFLDPHSTLDIRIGDRISVTGVPVMLSDGLVIDVRRLWVLPERNDEIERNDSDTKGSTNLSSPSALQHNETAGTKTIESEDDLVSAIDFVFRKL